MVLTKLDVVLLTASLLALGSAGLPGADVVIPEVDQPELVGLGTGLVGGKGGSGWVDPRLRNTKKNVHSMSIKQLPGKGGCLHQEKNLGTNFKTPLECLAVANAQCSEPVIMWTPAYNFAWGCRCCKSASRGDSNGNWQMYSADKINGKTMKLKYTHKRCESACSRWHESGHFEKLDHLGPKWKGKTGKWVPGRGFIGWKETCKKGFAHNACATCSRCKDNNFYCEKHCLTDKTPWSEKCGGKYGTDCTGCKSDLAKILPANKIAGHYKCTECWIKGQMKPCPADKKICQVKRPGGADHHGITPQTRMICDEYHKLPSCMFKKGAFGKDGCYREKYEKAQRDKAKKELDKRPWWQRVAAKDLWRNNRYG